MLFQVDWNSQKMKCIFWARPHSKIQVTFSIIGSGMVMWLSAPFTANPEIYAEATWTVLLFHLLWSHLSLRLPSEEWRVVLFLCLDFIFYLNFFKKNFYSVTIVCIFSPSLHPTPVNPTSLPHFYPPPWFCPSAFVVAPVDTSPHYPLPTPLWLLLHCS